MNKPLPEPELLRKLLRYDAGKLFWRKRPVGVSWSGKAGKWEARITVSNRVKHLGYFVDKADAILARLTAEKEHGFHPNHGRKT